MIAKVELFIFTAASTVKFAVVMLLKKPRFQGIKIYFCQKNAKKKKRGQPGLTLENIDSFCFHPSPKTIELFITN